MPLSLYMDEHVPSAVTAGLRLREIDVLTIQEDRGLGKADSWIIDRAAELGRVVCTMDQDILRETARRQREGVHFAGVFYIRSRPRWIGLMVAKVEKACRDHEPDELRNRVCYVTVS